MRRWRNLRLRRGQFFGPPRVSAVPAVPPPRVTRQAGTLQYRGLKAPRGHRWGPALPQGTQGQPYPYFAQPGRRPARGLRIPRGRVWQFPMVGAAAAVGTWTGSYAVTSGFFFPFPAARPLQIPVANTTGDWLICFVAWRPSTAGSGVSVTVADDAHNWWEPVGAGGAAPLAVISDTAGSPILDTAGSPILDTSAGAAVSADSPAAGAVRCAVWAAPAARVANPLTGQTVVQVAATGPVLSLAATVVDMSGIDPWWQPALITGGYAGAATSLSLAAPAPPAKAVLFAAFASDNNADTISWPSGWNALTGVTAGNGVDRTADIALVPSYQVTTSAASATSNASGTLDMAGVIAGVLVSAPKPNQPSPDWPVMITEAAIGSGVQTPPSQLTWTDLSSRALSLSMTQGRQYSLGQLSAGQGTITLDNPQGDLVPPGSGSYAGIDSGTPLRRRVIIPASPTPYYVAVNGFFRRWPWTMDAELYRGQTQAEIADAWAYATVTLNSMAIEECLLDSPHSLWPLTDPAGSAGGSNLAPGNSLQLTQVTSKLGPGGATTAWGQDSGNLAGAQGARVTSSGAGAGTGMWKQTLAGTSLVTNGYGYCLQCTDTSYPPLSGGVTAECWGSADVTAAFNAISGNGLFAITTPGGTFNTAGSNFTNGQPVILGTYGSATFPTPFAAGTVYYVVNDDGQGNYSLAAAPGGSVITPTSAGVTAGTIKLQLAWDPVIMSLRDGSGTVAGLSVRNTDGALLVTYRSGTGSATAVADISRDYRFQAQHHYSLAVTQTTWRVLVDGGGIANASGTFPAALPASFRTLCLAGVQDSTAAGYACPGTFAFAGTYPGVSSQVRVINRYQTALTGAAGEAACDRVERVLEYAGLAGRRWLGQQSVAYEGDLCTSGQDIGGQAAASSCGNIAQSTLPAMLYVAPTGDITYLSKLYTWNQPVRWTLGTNAAGGEIPFQPGSVATDYDPSRVVEDVQLTQLSTQAVTLPSGTTASTTMRAVAAATEAQYGGSAYQQSGYLEFDGSSQYTAGSGLNDLANWLANVYAKPANRVQEITVNAAANAANASSWLAWQFWAGASPGDMVQVNIRVPTAVTSPLISLTARITQTRRQSQYSAGGTSATITCALDFAAEYQALTCDDPVRGLLNGTNVMPWLPLRSRSPPRAPGRLTTRCSFRSCAPTCPTPSRCSPSGRTSSASAPPASRSPRRMT